MAEVSPERQQDVELVRRGLDAFNRGGAEELFALFDPEIELYLPPDLPNATHTRGLQEYQAWLDRWLEAWDDFQVSADRVEVAGDRHVVMWAHQSGKGKASGIPVEMDLAYLWEVRDGKVAAHHLYPSWEQAVEAAERREREAAA